MSARVRLNRAGCLIAEAELEWLHERSAFDEALPIIPKVLEKYPGVDEELVKKLETIPEMPPAWQDYAFNPSNLPDDEQERKVRKILEKRDWEHAAGLIQRPHATAWNLSRPRSTGPRAMPPRGLEQWSGVHMSALPQARAVYRGLRSLPPHQRMVHH